MVEHLGDRERPVRPPQRVRDQSAPRFTGTRPGSVTAGLELELPPGGQAYLGGYGARALAAIEAWGATEASTLPKPVADRLYAAASSLRERVRLSVGDARTIGECSPDPPIEA